MTLMICTLCIELNHWPLVSSLKPADKCGCLCHDPETPNIKTLIEEQYEMAFASLLDKLNQDIYKDTETG